MQQTNLILGRMTCSTSCLYMLNVEIKMADISSSSINRINGMCKSNLSLHHVLPLCCRNTDNGLFKTDTY